MRKNSEAEKLSDMGKDQLERESFLKAVHKFMEMMVPATLLRELIDHIDVYKLEGKGKDHTQRIVIYYCFVGYFELPEAEDSEK